jgi:ligand-binding sensor domain-containing protein
MMQPTCFTATLVRLCACTALALLLAAGNGAQDPVFKKVNTANGLSDNLVYDAAIDKAGLIWIGTGDGLNAFNGTTVTNWSPLLDSALGSRSVRQVYCDEKGCVWVVSTNGKIAILNEKRKALQVALPQGVTQVSYLLPARPMGLFALTGSRLLKYDAPSNSFVTVSKFPKSFSVQSIHPARRINQHQFLVFTANSIQLLDLNKGQFTRLWPVKRVVDAILLNSQQLLVTTGSDRQLLLMDTASGKVLNNYGELYDQNGEPVNGYLRHMARLQNGNILITSGYGGLYFFDPAREKLFHATHDPLNPNSVSANNTFHVVVDSTGFVFITTRSSGLNYFNTRYHQANYVGLFRDSKTNKFFDGFVGPIAQHSNGNVWLGTQGGLIEWNTQKNQATFHEYGMVDGQSIAGKEEVRDLHFDAYNRLWVGLNRYGVFLLKDGKAIRHFTRGSADTASRISGNFILDIKTGPDGNIWITTERGIDLIDPLALRNITVKIYPILKSLAGKYCYGIHFASDTLVWVGSSQGAHLVNLAANTRKHYSKQEGITNKSVTSIISDRNGVVYLAGRQGLNILKPNGQMETYNRATGFPADACLGLSADSAGNIWVTNDRHLVCFQPGTEGFRVFDESYGLAGNGFRLMSGCVTKEGKLMLGCNEGLLWADPAKLLSTRMPFSARIDALQTTSGTNYFSGNDTVRLPYEENNISFSVNLIAPFGTRPSIIQYKLEGTDATWRNLENSSDIAYRAMSPGTYVFRVRHHGNADTWHDAVNYIVVTVARPWWRQLWFVALVTVLVASLLLWAFNNRMRAKRQKQEELETERAIHYFANSMHTQSSVEEIAWDFTRNCISRLHFEDCVVYFLDPQRQLLQQIAAWGDKAYEHGKIINRIQIPLGSGIVGSVAQSGEPAIISDTRKAPNYIVDEKERLSEICVPIMAEGKVLGVIDSEHSKRDFFTKKHLAILTTLASLLASKMVSAQAESEKRQAEIALLENRRRTAEVEMQALRAQMNPHFMFNSLNSINNFILKSDTENASEYLTRFARLMRLILDNSRNEWVSLENELKALKLYIEMESLRFDNVFSYQVVVDPTVDATITQLPPMLIQPYVENAIWHGLLHRKEPGSNLRVQATNRNDMLVITIEDNGIGRKAAEALKSNFGTHKQSHGMKITAERLASVNAVYGIHAQATVEDLINATGQVAGTCVTLTMKYRIHESNHY